MHRKSLKNQTICSAAKCQIGPRFIKIEPNPDHFPVQIRIKSGPKWPPNLDQFHKIRLLLDFYKNSQLFEPYIIHGIVVPFLVKYGLLNVNPDNFRTNFSKKVRIGTKVWKKQPIWEHYIWEQCLSGLFFLWLLIPPPPFPTLKP